MLYPFFNLLLSHFKFKYGIDIPYSTEIGSGLYIGHFGGIIVNNKAVIGDNCNLSQDITIGETFRGIRKGFPLLANNIYVGPGARIIGNVKVGSNVAIGANCVVTKDVPDNAVVVGVPGKIISYDGTAGLIIRTDYK